MLKWIGVVLLLIALLGVVAWFVVDHWPSQWPPAQQATLAGALIGLTGTIFTVVGKWFFDHISIDTKHTISVREKILERFYKYAGNYLVPIASIAGQLSTYFGEFRDAHNSKDHKLEKEALHAALYYVGKYIEVQNVLSGLVIPQKTDPPEGIFLQSLESEQLTWALMIPPRAFGFQTLEHESLLVQELTSHTQVEFIRLLDDPQSSLHHLVGNLDNALQEDWPNKVTDISDTLNSFNLILAHELTEVYRPWYRSSVPYPRRALAAVLAIPESRRSQIGILYNYPATWAEKKAYNWWSRRFQKQASSHPS